MISLVSWWKSYDSVISRLSCSECVAIATPPWCTSLCRAGERHGECPCHYFFMEVGDDYIHIQIGDDYIHIQISRKKLIYHYHALQSGFKIGSRNSCGFRLRCFPSFLCSSSLDCNPDVGVVSEVYLKHVFILGSCDIVRCLQLETSASLKLVFLDSLAASGYRGTKARSRNGRGTNESKRPADMLRVLELEIPETLKGLWLRLWLNSYFGMVKAQNIHGSFHDLFHMEGQQ